MSILLLLFFILSSNAWAQKESTHVTKSILELSAMADFRCVQAKPVGVCPKANREPPIGVKVRFWQPEVFMETVKMPGDYVITEYGVTLGSLAKTTIKTELEVTTHIKPLTVTSGSSFNSLSTSNLQFNEVHLYDFPSDGVFGVLCSDVPNATMGIRYLSEGDSITWRRGDIEKDLPQSLVAENIGAQCNNLALGATAGQCMKSWGPLYPREGFVVTPSGLVSSIVDALRAVSIASNPFPHLVEAPLDFQPNIVIDKIQMVYPVKTSCFSIGQNPSQWETDKQSKDGHYVWIFWHQRECCM